MDKYEKSPTTALATDDHDACISSCTSKQGEQLWSYGWKSPTFIKVRLPVSRLGQIEETEGVPRAYCGASIAGDVELRAGATRPSG